MRGKKGDYTVYDGKTGEVVAFGSSRECAKTLGMTLAAFYSALKGTRVGQYRKYEIVEETWRDRP